MEHLPKQKRTGKIVVNAENLMFESEAALDMLMSRYSTKNENILS